jgi:hypothetical protein
MMTGCCGDGVFVDCMRARRSERLTSWRLIVKLYGICESELWEERERGCECGRQPSYVDL